MLVAWIWSGIWYMLLDPIKWCLCWLLNEDGFRDRGGLFPSKEATIAKASKDQGVAMGGEPGSRQQHLAAGQAGIPGPSRAGSGVWAGGPGARACLLLAGWAAHTCVHAHTTHPAWHHAWVRKC